MCFGQNFKDAKCKLKFYSQDVCVIENNCHIRFITDYVRSTKEGNVFTGMSCPGPAWSLTMSGLEGIGLHSPGYSCLGPAWGIP